MKNGFLSGVLLTVGHSNHTPEDFIELLASHGVTAIADVRSSPYSRFSPQFNRETLKATLASQGIAYTFLGRELGARSDNPLCYRDGKVQYALLAQQPQFFEGLARITEGMQRFNVALMCAERDPVECHRALLVARAMTERGSLVSHIHAAGTIEPQQEFESRLLSICHLPEGDMFRSREEFVSDAYKIQGDRVAYQDEEMRRREAIAS